MVSPVKGYLPIALLQEADGNLSGCSSGESNICAGNYAPALKIDDQALWNEGI